MWQAIPLALLFLNSVASAENEKSAKTVCAPLDKLLPLVKTCHENELFVKVAEMCNKRVKDAIDRAQQQLTAVAGARLALDPSSQRNNLLETQATLLKTQLTLEHFLRISEKTLQELTDYSSRLKFPASASKEEIKRLGLESFFAEFPCYNENGARLVQNITKAMDRVEDLRKTSKDTAELQAKLGVALKRMEQNSSASGMVNSGVSENQEKNALPASAGRGKSTNRTSDITGIRPKQDQPDLKN